MQTCPSHVILQRVVVQIIYCSGVRLAATSSRQRRLYFKFYGKKLFIMLIFGNGHWSHKFTFYHLRNQIEKYFGLHRITGKLLATIQINLGCSSITLQCGVRWNTDRSRTINLSLAHLIEKLVCSFCTYNRYAWPQDSLSFFSVVNQWLAKVWGILHFSTCLQRC